MAKKNFAERYEPQIAEELREKGFSKKKEIANRYGCDIGQIMAIAKKFGIDSKGAEEVKLELNELEKINLASAMLSTRGDVVPAAENIKLDVELCKNAASKFYHPRYDMLPNELNYDTVKMKVLIAIMILKPNSRTDIYEILKDDSSFIKKSCLKDLTNSNIASAIFNLKQDELIEQDYLPVVKKSPTIRISQMTTEQFTMVAEAVDNNMTVIEIADMLGCSTGMVYDVFKTNTFKSAMRRYKANKKITPTEPTEPVEELKLMVEPVVAGPDAHEAPTDSPITLEALNNEYRALETAYNSKLVELQQIKEQMAVVEQKIEKFKEKEAILKKVEELDRQRKALMDQLQSL